MLDFTLTPRNGDGDPVDVSADASDVYFWEKTHAGKTFTVLLRERAMVDLYQVAHLAAQRTGVYDGKNVDDFARAYTLAWRQESVADESEVDPTRTAP